MNRVNPIFQDDNDDEEPYVFHKRTPSEEQRENETKSSDDTGYSSGQRKAANSLTDLTDGGSFDNHMSSDSDDSPEALVVSADVHRVSFPDDIIILSSSSTSYRSETLSSGESFDTRASFNEGQFNSLTSSNITDISRKQEDNMVGRNSRSGELRSEAETEVKRPYSNERLTLMRNKLQSLLQHGTQSADDDHDDSPDFRKAEENNHIDEKSKDDLIRSLNRILNKVPNSTEPSMRNSPSYEADRNVTRTDSSTDNLADLDKALESTVLSAIDSPTPQPPPLPKPNTPQNGGKSGVTRQDESSISSSNDSSVSEQKKYRHRHRHHERNKEHVHNGSGFRETNGTGFRETNGSGFREKNGTGFRESNGSGFRETNGSGFRETEQTHHKKHSPPCKLCGVSQKSLNLHQFLPGHWSYDNIYLPQMPNVCYYCLHDRLQPMSEEEIFHNMYHNEKGKVRHSWAPQTSYNFKQNQKDFRRTLPNEGTSDHRYSPDGSSHDTAEEEKERDVTSKDVGRVKIPHGERRSLRVPKKCKCDECLSSSLHDDMSSHMPLPYCTCHFLPHRKVKFASDSDLTRHSHDGEGYMESVSKSFRESSLKNLDDKLHLSLNSNFQLSKMPSDRDKIKSDKLGSQTLARGQREPVKVDDLYRSYPMNYQEWEAQYRRKFVQKRRKRALNMVGMAIGIILVVGVAIAMTFIFLRLKRPT